MSDAAAKPMHEVRRLQLREAEGGRIVDSVPVEPRPCSARVYADGFIAAPVLEAVGENGDVLIWWKQVELSQGDGLTLTLGDEPLVPGLLVSGLQG